MCLLQAITVQGNCTTKASNKNIIFWGLLLPGEGCPGSLRLARARDSFLFSNPSTDVSSCHSRYADIVGIESTHSCYGFGSAVVSLSDIMLTFLSISEVMIVTMVGWWTNHTDVCCHELRSDYVADHLRLVRHTSFFHSRLAGQGIQERLNHIWRPRMQMLWAIILQRNSTTQISNKNIMMCFGGHYGPTAERKPLRYVVTGSRFDISIALLNLSMPDGRHIMIVIRWLAIKIELITEINLM
jgi:hypothetical protein